MDLVVVVLLFLPLIQGSAVVFDCDNPPADYSTLAFGHYWKLTGYVNYATAEAECAGDGTRLAMVTNWYELEWIKAKYKCKLDIHV